MELRDLLLSDDIEAWIAALPRYQAAIIREFLDRGMPPETAAQEWLSASGPMNTFPFGAQVAKDAFYDKLVLELEAFLCGDQRYAEDRRRLIGDLKPGQAYTIASISAIIAPAVGASAALIAPAIAMLLFVAAKIGLNAWCAMRKEGRAEGA
jgi:hypothetical protein